MIYHFLRANKTEYLLRIEINIVIKRVKALNKIEFEQSCSNGSVYGKYKGLFVYIELGIEQDYREHPLDNPKTEYKLFKNCYIEYAQTIEELETGEPKAVDSNINVVLYW